MPHPPRPSTGCPAGPVAGSWSDGLEGYARSFLLAAFRIAGSGGRWVQR